ncbi:hypothetical protein ANN_12683 [Periplaneta americana]|uniref:Uncharacterized protein n=1 Tax=Periplaneta americana TaxID=6978 RepID=A0ABQ8TJT6_PERAM|nr:hypothetical protein ANN_12683 [Periplaneta americana]
MDRQHLAKCPALKSSKEVDRYWEARARIRLAVASFRINTEHDILGKHLNLLGILPSASCILCHQQEDMDRQHLAKYPALKSSKEVGRYWEARARMQTRLMAFNLLCGDRKAMSAYTVVRAPAVICGKLTKPRSGEEENVIGGSRMHSGAHPLRNDNVPHWRRLFSSSHELSWLLVLHYAACLELMENGV